MVTFAEDLPGSLPQNYSPNLAVIESPSKAATVARFMCTPI